MSGYSVSFEQAVAAASAGVTVLTPNTRSARCIRTAAERRLQASHSAWITPDVVPFGAFIERLYSDALIGGVLTRQSLHRQQEMYLWRQVIEHSSTGKELLFTKSAAALASESFRTATEYEIRLDSPLMSVSNETRAFSTWALEFQRQLVQNEWTCAALLMHELIGAVSSLRLPKSLCVAMPEITLAQRRFLDALSASGVQVGIVDHSYACNQDEEAERHEFDSIADELRAAAHWARSQVEAAPESRIGVIVFDLARKIPQVEHAFRTVLHPEHLFGQSGPAAYEVASPLPLAEYPPVRCAVQLLTLFAGPFDFDSLCAVLTSPYLDAEPTAAARFIAQFRKTSRRRGTLQDLIVALQSSRELSNWKATLQSLPSQSLLGTPRSAGYWVDVSRKILDAFGWPGRAPLNSEEFQCTEACKELLTSIASLDLFDYKTDFAEFVAQLSSAASAQNFKPETRNAPVQIMDVAESEGSMFDAVWVASCSDDLWPDSPRHSPLLPTALLRDAGAPLVGTPGAEARISRVTARLLQSAPSVVLSMARRSDDEREQRWSPCFAPYSRSASPSNIPASVFESITSAELQMLSDSKAPAVRPDDIARGGTWLLQDQSNCPFRAFATRRLLAREMQGPSEALAPNERGNLIDRALQLIWEELKDSDGLHRPDCAAVIERGVSEAMRSALPKSEDAWSLKFRELERKRTIEVVTNWLKLESTRKPFHVLGHQLPVELTLGQLTLHGYVDRLDETDSGHLVLDYKTGAKNTIAAWQVPRPQMPQLPFYALAMRQQKFDIAGISFAVVRKDECEFRSYLRDSDALPGPDSAKRTFDGVPFKEYTAKWAESLQDLASAFLQGEAAVDPRIAYGRSGSPCEHCHLTALCRVGDLPSEGLMESVEESYE